MRLTMNMFTRSTESLPSSRRSCRSMTPGHRAASDAVCIGRRAPPQDLDRGDRPAANPRLGRTVSKPASALAIARTSGRCLWSYHASAERPPSSGLPVRRGRSPLVLKATCICGEDSDQSVSSSVVVVNSQLASVLSPGHEILRLIEAPRVSFAAHRRGALSLAG